MGTMAIPDLLRRIRELRGWSQTDLGAHLGVTANTVARWERGEVNPHPLRVPQLEKELRRAESYRARMDANRARRAHPEAVALPTDPLARAGELLRRIGA